jgi:ABC-2 type transport system permease protein
MKNVFLALRQVRYENRAFWRNPPSAFFTFVFPLMFLAIFNLLFGNEEIALEGGITHTSTFYVPSIAALSVVSACYTNIAISVSFSRDQGLLKRIRGTPLPNWAFIFGRIVQSVGVGYILVAIITLAGMIFYNVTPPTNTLPAFIVTLAIGAATFSSLGLAVTGLIPNAEASPAIVNASILPLLFISDVFIPMHNVPEWLISFADIFPVRHFSVALQNSFNPFESGLGFEVTALVVMSIWLTGGIAATIKFFSWEPRK